MNAIALLVRLRLLDMLDEQPRLRGPSWSAEWAAEERRKLHALAGAYR